jgi:hypothetical protein
LKPRINQNDVFEVIKTDEIVKVAKSGGHSFKFELMNVLSGEIAILYFNAVVGKNSYKVHPNSKFAKLYRLDIGENPRKRYCKAHQLRSHFIGKELRCKTEDAQYSNGDYYNKVIEVEPVSPIVTDEWTSTGKLKGKCRGRYKSSEVSGISSPSTRLNGDLLESDRKEGGDELAKTWREGGDVKSPSALVNPRHPDVFQVQTTDNISTDNRQHINR